MLYSETYSTGGMQLSYVRLGEWSRDVILFFHGFTGSKEYFPDTEKCRKCIVSFDRPGVGGSSVVPYYLLTKSDICCI